MEHFRIQTEEPNSPLTGTHSLLRSVALSELHSKLAAACLRSKLHHACQLSDESFASLRSACQRWSTTKIWQLDLLILEFFCIHCRLFLTRLTNSRLLAFIANRGTSLAIWDICANESFVFASPQQKKISWSKSEQNGLGLHKADFPRSRSPKYKETVPRKNRTLDVFTWNCEQLFFALSQSRRLILAPTTNLGLTDRMGWGTAKAVACK